MSINDKIFELLINDDEITWQSILTNLVKSENNDIWDVNIISLTDQFIETITKLKELDFRVSGKIVLAAAILLRMKSVYLVTDGASNFDRLINTDDDDDETEELDFNEGSKRLRNKSLDDFGIVPRTPLPRKRKVSVYDLINALQKAIEVKNRRVTRLINDKPYDRFKKLIDVKTDISKVIGEVYSRIVDLSKDNQELQFESLLYMDVNEALKRDKVLTFLPLLHLETKDKIEINQRESFGNILVKLRPEFKNIQVVNIDEKSLVLNNGESLVINNNNI